MDNYFSLNSMVRTFTGRHCKYIFPFSSILNICNYYSFCVTGSHIGLRDLKKITLLNVYSRRFACIINAVWYIRNEWILKNEKIQCQVLLNHQDDYGVWM